MLTVAGPLSRSRQVQIEYDAGRSRCQLEVTLVDNADLASRKLVQAGQLPAYLRASMSATLSRLQAATRQDLYDRRDADALAEPLDVQQAAASAWAGAFKAVSLRLCHADPRGRVACRDRAVDPTACSACLSAT